MLDFFDFQNSFPSISRMKTQTKKSPTKKASTQEKSPVAKKSVAPKKTAPKAKAQKSAPKKSVPIVAPAPVKKVATKKIAPKKETPVALEAAPKVEKKKSSPSQNSGKEGVKMLGILHLVGNLFSGGVLGIILVILYLVIRKNELSQLEKETCYEIINFNLSFILYAFVAACSMILLIGFVLLPVVVITGLVLMIMGFLRHLVGENYKYPFIIRFVS